MLKLLHSSLISQIPSLIDVPHRMLTQQSYRNQRKPLSKSSWETFRGLNDHGKQQALKEWLQENQKLNVVMLTETKLTRRLKIQNWRELQSQFHRAGGCWSAINSNESVKQIKYFDTTLSWISATFHYVPVHIITMYLPPQNTTQATKTLGNLEHVLSLIIDRLPNSKIILGGDFNEHRSKVEQIGKKRGLKALLPNGTTTHEKGNHLDQVLTNLVIGEYELCPVYFSDHLFIHARLKFLKTTQDIDVRAMPRQPTMQQIKIAANCAKTIEILKSESWKIQIPAIQKFEQDILSQPVVKQWYHPKGRWNSQKSQFESSLDKDDWRQQLKSLHELHDNGDQRGFFELVKKLTQIKPKQPVVRGLIGENGEANFIPQEVNKIISNYLKNSENGNILDNPSQKSLQMTKIQLTLIFLLKKSKGYLLV